MYDSRVGLKNNSILKYNNEKEITIVSEIGRGGSCIIYDAYYFDSIGISHKIRVKEFYPYYINISRKTDGTFILKEKEYEKFSAAKKLFIEAYKRNTLIRNTLSLTNSTINTSDIFEKNNTIYTILSIDEGIDYQKYQDNSLKELFIHVKSLALLVGKYHKSGYLHLDIKPENIFIIPETDEHIFLFDFDSVTKKNEIIETGNCRLSFSEGFSAPELIRGKIDKIGECSDIYSIGALLYYKLFEKIPTSDVRKISYKFDFSKHKFSDQLFNPKLYKLLEIFFKKTLSLSVVSRWNNMSIVIKTIEELIELSDTDNRFILNDFQYNSGCFLDAKVKFMK